MTAADIDSLPPETAQIIREIYGEVPAELHAGILDLLRDPNRPDVANRGPMNRRGMAEADPPGASLWDASDVMLISYADQVREPGHSPLAALRRFLDDHRWQELLRIVHLLPFFPSTGDDGFSVSDYEQVDPAFGTWDDVAALGDSFDLAFDLVLNHSSRHHRWCQRFLAGDPEFADFYHELPADADVSQVVRPRSLPLLTPFETPAGRRYLWTTFSEDQVDLNYANPRVLLAMLRTLVAYLRGGARIVRLDAVAFLWKQLGTPCIHLPQTHAVVRLFRDLVDRLAPGTLLLTETNVPHPENIGYFGNGDDEAHLVYQFSLPPLLLDAIHSGDTTFLGEWIAGLETASPTTNFLNFTASHDGIGVRPLEGLVPAARVQQLVDRIRRHGGRVSTRRAADGSDQPYELNITYVDAVADRRHVPPAEHARRFLATQAFMLALKGIPAIYFHSLVGSPNDLAAVHESGQNRRIHRHKYDRQELEAALGDADSLPARVHIGYRHLLSLRRRCPAFHPSAAQRAIEPLGEGVVGFWRAPETPDRMAVLANLSDRPRQVRPRPLGGAHRDRISGITLPPDAPIPIAPYQVLWLTP